MDSELTGPRLCGHCGVIVQMRILATHDEHPPEEIDDPAILSVRYGILGCLNCYEVSFGRYWWSPYDQYQHSEPFRDETLFPPAATAPVGLPTDLVRLFEGCLKIKHIHADAYVTQVRKLLEIVCQRHGAVGRTLADKIDSLAESGKIPADLAKVAHNLRLLGNHGAHAAVEEVPIEAVPVVEKLSAALLGYLYSMPLLVTEAEELLKKLDESGKPKAAETQGRP